MRVIIIGNGIAGNSAARAIKEARPATKVTIVTEERDPFYSACALARLVSGNCEEKDVIITSFEEARRLGIELITGEMVSAIDPRTKSIKITRGSIEYDQLILATGSKARLFNVSRSEQAGVFALKTLQDARLLQEWKGKKAVIVGSGPVGVETAAALKMRGLKVTLVEAQENILPEVLTPYLAKEAHQLMEKSGIEVKTGCRYQAVEGINRVKAVVLSKETISCDTLVFACGTSANTGLARAAGIELGSRGGILVDKQMKTSVANIFAGGDCVELRPDLDTDLEYDNRVSMLWVNARRQGWVAGLNAINSESEYVGNVSAVAIDLFGATILSAGRKPSGAINEKTYNFESRTYKAQANVRDEKVIGLQLVGLPSREYGRILMRLVSGCSDKDGLPVLDFSNPRNNCSTFMVWDKFI